jgi:hypothetical protein
MLLGFQPSLRDLESVTPPPNAEALGYSHASLRDENEILVALGISACRFTGLSSPVFMRGRLESCPNRQAAKACPTGTLNRYRRGAALC